MKYRLYYAKQDLLPTDAFGYLNDDMTIDIDTPVARMGEVVSDAIRKAYPSQVGTFKHDGVYTQTYHNVVYSVPDGLFIKYYVHIQKLA